MNQTLVLNGVIYAIDFDKYQNSLLLIDLRKYVISCEVLNNTILFFMKNPRINIQLISTSFEFYFEQSPEAFMLGQVVSKSLISYRTHKSIHFNVVDNNDYLPCILFTKGLLLEEILIYMPIQKLLYIRELQYSFFNRSIDQCCICLDVRDDVINVHQNQYHHVICSECLLQIHPPLCPICRQKII